MSTTQPRLIAAHHIALLLLSTAAPHSDEHADIVELNGAGIWKALEEIDLVLNEDGLWHLTKRGQQYVEALLALPLPGASTPASWRKARLGRVLRAASAPDARDPAPRKRSGAVQNLQPASADSPGPEQLGAGVPPDPNEDDEGEPPPRAPNPKPIPGIMPAPTHAERMKQAEGLFNQGFGLNEVAETLDMDASELEARYFR